MFSETMPSNDETYRHVLFIRHGESVTNSGGTWPNPFTNPLTEKGRDQADLLSSVLTEEPNLIVTSPYVRTKQTAEPVIHKWPAAEHEEWPVQEFTQLCYQTRGLLEKEEKRSILQQLWEDENPSYCDGPYAESFFDLQNRINWLLDRLKKLEHRKTYIFTHGYFLKAFFCRLENPEKNTISMGALKAYKDTLSIPNTCIFHCTISNEGEIRTCSRSIEHLAGMDLN